MHLPCAAVVISLFTIHHAIAEELPWERHTFDFESGMLWQVGNNTDIDYEFVQTQFSWRSPYVFKWEMGDGTTLVVRNQASLIAAWITEGPEDYYFGLSGAPSLKWWSADARWSWYFSIGGGIGVTNSTNVPGGQGQDFTLNWFAKTGLRHQLTQDIAIFGGPFFQHMSNGGATDPNPGIDVLGFTIGASFSF
jgi:hypothetical protein